ncbi:hypothetical protein EVAR_44703_1 [Eumeta japonica]|uniref:Uncharacterized protein n=1 Tax=Eumeta variegata TaxID=151549 RepID=A0A4C1XHH2_EUMVA|nr:hypothetical protein EVAR_44703_1 [Eumeta japonica]
MRDTSDAPSVYDRKSKKISVRLLAVSIVFKPEGTEFDPGQGRAVSLSQVKPLSPCPHSSCAVMLTQYRHRSQVVANSMCRRYTPELDTTEQQKVVIALVTTVVSNPRPAPYRSGREACDTSPSMCKRNCYAALPQSVERSALQANACARLLSRGEPASLGYFSVVQRDAESISFVLTVVAESECSRIANARLASFSTNNADCPEDMKTTSSANAYTYTPNSPSTRSKESRMMFQKVVPAIEPYIQPLEVSFLHFPPAYGTIDSRCRSCNRLCERVERGTRKPARWVESKKTERTRPCHPTVYSSVSL